MTDTIDGFFELFQGNLQAYGTEDGGCARIENPTSDPQGRMKNLMKLHLTGDDSVCIAGQGMGIYPMVFQPTFYDVDAKQHGGWYVKWGAIDFDEGQQESWVHAKNVHLALQTFGITGWIERSRSKGYHVWVFLQEWTEAWLVRQALLAACQIVDAPTREINPKQVDLQPGQLGNYLRAPYPGKLGKLVLYTDRRVMVDPDTTQTLELAPFVSMALQERTDVLSLEKLAGYYKPPVKLLRTRDWSSQVLDGESTDRLLGKARIIWEQGPLEGGDRSDTLYKLAMYLKEDGRHTRDEAFELLADADERWGKFSDRPDCEQRLNDMLDKAGF